MNFRTFVMASAMLSGLSLTALAQSDSSSDDDLDALLGDVKTKDYTTATFKATRLISGHTIETLGAGVLDFRIAHRFNTVENGFENFFGMDGASTKIGFDYGVTDWLMVGAGRSGYQQEYDGYVKAKLLRQSKQGMPFTLTYYGSMMASAQKVDVPDGYKYYFSNRLCYANQLLIARKFSESLSLQLMPTHVHYNLVATKSDPNNVFAIGVGGRMKLSRRVSLNAEWYCRVGDVPSGTKNALGIGFDIETGGHVFQLHFTNSTGLTERTFVGQTTGDWGKGQIRFGFNISRVFTIVKPKEFKNQ